MNEKAGASLEIQEERPWKKNDGKKQISTAGKWQESLPRLLIFEGVTYQR